MFLCDCKCLRGVVVVDGKCMRGVVSVNCWCMRVGAAWALVLIVGA